MGFLTSILTLCSSFCGCCVAGRGRTDGRNEPREKRPRPKNEAQRRVRLQFVELFLWLCHSAPLCRGRCRRTDGEQYVCILLQSVCMHGVHMHMRHRAPPKEGGRRCSGVVGRIKKGLLLSTTPRATCYIVN